MKNAQGDNKPPLKVNNCIELPIEKAKPDGIIHGLGFANNQQIYFTKKNQIYFVDLVGELTKKSSKKYGKSLICDQKTALSYDYERVDDLFEVTFDYYDLSAGKIGKSQQSFTFKIKRNWHMLVSHQRQLFLTVTEFGLHVTRYSPSSWDELGFIEHETLEKYQADFKKVLLDKHTAVLASKEGQITLYDYTTHQVSQQFGLKNTIANIDVSPCENYLIIQQVNDQRVIFLQIDTQEIAFKSAPNVKDFDIQGDFVALIYQDKTIEVYQVASFECLGYCDYFKDSLVDRLQFKFHDSEPQLLVSNSDQALVFSWGANDTNVQLPFIDQEKYTSYYQSLEQWNPTQTDQTLTKIKEVGKEDKREKILIQRFLQHRYSSLIQYGIINSTLKALRDLPTRWEKLNTDKKARILRHWPPQVPFFTTSLDLSAKLRVDSWRYSHYKHQLGDDFPNQLHQLNGVTHLYINHQQFSELPTTIFEMNDLEVLDLEDNDLKALPEDLLKLTNLKVLILKQNYGLKEIPDLGQLSNLEEIDFEYTDISSLPEGFFKLKNIKKINTIQSELDRDTKIISRLLDAFPDAEITTRARKAIEMENNMDMDEYKGQEKISIDSFELNYLPQSLFAADKVKELIIDCSNLKELPDTFDQLPTLEKLHIETRGTNTLPDSIAKLPQLKELRLEGNFKALPDNLGDLSNLDTLIIEHGQFKELPASLAQLPKLKTLKTKYLNIDQLGEVVGNIATLETLVLEDVFVEGGKVFTVAPALLQLNNLKEVSLDLRSGKLDQSVFNLPNSIQELSLEVWHNYDRPYETSLSFQKLINHFHQVTKLSLEGLKLTNTKTALNTNTTLKDMTTRDVLWKQLPDDIYQLQALNYLTLFDAKLEALNPAIYQCPALEYLRLSNFQQPTIPAGIEQMTQLKKLGFERSNISSLPDDIFQLQQLEKLCLGECPLFSNASYKAKIKRKIKGLKVTKEWYT